LNLVKSPAVSTGRCNTGLQFTRRGFRRVRISRTPRRGRDSEQPRVFDQINGPYEAKIPYSYGHYSKVVGILERVLTGVELGFNRVGNIDVTGPSGPRKCPINACQSGQNWNAESTTPRLLCRLGLGIPDTDLAIEDRGARCVMSQDVIPDRLEGERKIPVPWDEEWPFTL
jgi:hypothetical protein